MYGHVEQPEDWVDHICCCAPFSKGPADSPSLCRWVLSTRRRRCSAPVWPGLEAFGREDVAIHALARILLNNSIPNIQLAWLKLGWEVARLCLQAGVNDCGGTLWEENITSASGEVAGTSATPEQLQSFILSEGRIPVERSTTYRILRRFEAVA